jgi:predicted DNA-binding transcriptional regulator AlpA
MSFQEDDVLLTAAEAAKLLALSRPGFWVGVARGDLPAPFYLLPRAPRWSRNELLATVAARRALPRDQMAKRRAARAARATAAAE